MFSGLTSLSFAGAQPQELSPWFFSQNLWLSSGIALGSDCQMASDQPVVKFYLLQNPRIICVEVEDLLKTQKLTPDNWSGGLLKTQKLTQDNCEHQPSSTKLPFSQIGCHFISATVRNIPFETCRYVSLYLISARGMSLRNVSSLGSNLASVADLKRVQTPHSLCCDFRGYKTFTTRW